MTFRENRSVLPVPGANAQSAAPPPTQMADGKSASNGTFIDLFCGCGGFTLGMVRAGFECVAAIDFDEFAASTLQKNLPTIANVLQKDLTKYKPEELSKLTGYRYVDVIVGGPPCQGFSLARSADGANHGKRLTEDPRRSLYREFLKYVAYFQPKIFVMENVLGVRAAAEGEYFTRIHHEARNLGRADGFPGYRVHAQVEDAYALGVPQKRRRQLFIGVRADLRGHFIPELLPAQRANPGTTLGDAIGDLPILRVNSGDHEREYDLKRRNKHLGKGRAEARSYLSNVLEIERAPKLTSHVARPHSDRDLRDFARLREGESSTIARRERKVKFEFPYDKSCFKDRYTRQSRFQPCSTIVAHLSKDGLMFIHPTQARSLTPREVARVQSFPDWFSFPESRTRAYRMIGNAVPPLVAEAVGNAVTAFLREQALGAKSNSLRFHKSAIELRDDLEALADSSSAELRAISRETFVPVWQALLALFPHVHPDNALDHGSRKASCPDVFKLFPRIKGLKRLRYLRSGWPVAFENLGREAWRRRNAGELELAEFYLLAEPGPDHAAVCNKVWRE